jgi:3-hydroxybutyryl-CoA dehydrogenase
MSARMAGYDVIMTDISQEALDSAIALIDATWPPGGARQDHRRGQGRGAGRISTTLKLTDVGPPTS